MLFRFLWLTYLIVHALCSSFSYLYTTRMLVSINDLASLSMIDDLWLGFKAFNLFETMHAFRFYWLAYLILFMLCDSCCFHISLHLGIRKRYRKCGWFSVFATNNKSKLKQSRSEENLVNSVVEKVKKKRRVCKSFCAFKVIIVQTLLFLCIQGQPSCFEVHACFQSF